MYSGTGVCAGLVFWLSFFFWLLFGVVMSVFFIDSSKRSAVTQRTREHAASRQPRPAGLHSTASNLGMARFRVGILGKWARIGYRPGRRRAVFQPLANGCNPLIDWVFCFVFVVVLLLLVFVFL